jgi:RsiW-degrading membrane proteinase PrsW (M82 family)
VAGVSFTVQAVCSSEAALSTSDAQRVTSPYVDSTRTKDRSAHWSRFNLIDLLILIVSLLWGMIAGVVVTLPLETVLTLPDGVVAFIEEPAKLFPLIVVAIWCPALLYSKKKCAVFGAIAGLGFDVVENLWYFVHVPKHLFVAVVVGRTVFLPTHLIYSALAALGLMYIASRHQYYYAVALFALAILCHFVWNTVTPTVGIYIIPYALMIVLFVLIYRIVPDHVADKNTPPTTLDVLFHRD